nr:L-lactate dehydrogenase B-like [Tanacetum cinerariifolium]
MEVESMRGVGDEEVIVGEGVVVTSSSLEMFTNNFLGGIMISLIFLEGLEEETLVEFMAELFKEDDKRNGNASSLALGPGGLDIAQSFFKPIHGASQPSTTSRNTKISVIGVGNVGMAIAQTILTQDLADEIALLDVNADKLRAASPEAILLIVSNPVDVLTYVAWKLSGLPSNRVIGFGTNLDSSRFRFLIADHLDVNAQNVQANIMGEHGDSSVALWSSISVGGVPILSFLERQQIAYEKQTLEKIHKEVVQGAHEVIGLKGYTSWAIGYSVANLARAILRDQHKVHPVSVLAKGLYGIGEDVFISPPTQLGRSGALGVTNLHLSEEESQQLQKSAKTILEVQSQLGL